MAKSRKKIHIDGIVQGVGFRPFVYRLAQKYHLAGWVSNNSSGVDIEAEGEISQLTAFLRELREEPPVLAQVTCLKVEELPLRGESGFQIRQSSRTGAAATLIAPDIATCNACLAELHQPNDRRYHYPFINCTDCGPRYTIIKQLPYDRPFTTMAEFQMCPECLKEYENPADRRFHAQPNACPRCGPEIWLEDALGRRESGDVIIKAAELLKTGHILAVKGLGGFHLAVDARNSEAVVKLRERKHRYAKPLAVMCRDESVAKNLAEINPREMELLTSLQRPIVLCRKKQPEPLAPEISPDNDYYGMMLPYTPLHELLLKSGPCDVLVMTSGNISEEPLCHKNEDARRRLGAIADYFLMHNREIYQRADDSVTRIIGGRLSFIRRSRGFVPQPVLLKRELPEILATGGELKNSFAVLRKNQLFTGPHIGDLKNLETLEFFEDAVGHFLKILEVRPVAVACDKHPDYLSTRWAEKYHEKVIPVQHHHAHVAAVMAEHGLEGEVIGFALDGVGYGEDGTIWGGEILRATPERFERVGRFRPFLQPGGDAASRAPWKMAVALGMQAGLKIEWEQFFPEIPEEQLALLEQILRGRINSPLSSSCGRVFDAFSALSGLQQITAYEGQAAMRLEAAISEEFEQHPPYHFPVSKEKEFWEIDYRVAVAEAVSDRLRGEAAGLIARRFHDGLVEALAELAGLVREVYRCGRVVLGGGCFQNRYLTEKLTAKLEEKGFKVYSAQLLPPNDGGLAAGQAYVAAHLLENGRAFG
ncbi:MAG: carbamoyltransferase HypF [Calditrichia bacterium]